MRRSEPLDAATPDALALSCIPDGCSRRFGVQRSQRLLKGVFSLLSWSTKSLLESSPMNPISSPI